MSNGAVAPDPIAAVRKPWPTTRYISSAPNSNGTVLWSSKPSVPQVALSGGSPGLEWHRRPAQNRERPANR